MGIKDTNNNELVNFSTTASAVNEITVKNAATTAGPEISATGTDTNIDLKLTPKGSGKLDLDGIKFPNADGTAGQVLSTNGSGALSFVDGGSTSVVTSQVYDTGTGATWTKPASASFVEIRIWGGGGSGAQGNTNEPGGGGGGGACNLQVFPFSYISGSTVTYTVGAGGASRTAANSDGLPGGTSSVTISNFNGTGSKTFSAFGGGGGEGGTNSLPGGGGGGGGVLSVGSQGGTINGGTAGKPERAPGGGREQVTGGESPTYRYFDAEGAAYGGGGGGSGYNTTDANSTKAGGGSYWGGGGGGGAYRDSGTLTLTAGGVSYWGGGGGGGGVIVGTGGSGGTSVFGGAGSAGTKDSTASSAGSVPGGGSGGTEDGVSGAGGGGRVQFLYW